jgi:hypothetical protein
LHQFSERVVHDTSLGLHIRSLFLFMETLDSPDSEVWNPDNEAVMNIVSRAPRLNRVYGADFPSDCQNLLYMFYYSTMRWEGFCLLADTAGSSLISFENVSIRGTAKLYTSPCPLYSFTTLQSLFWDCNVKFKVDDEAILKDCFPCLESLRISSCHSSFLTLLTHIE